ncbi:MAG: T9SS type A sorting domain-containing protein [Bacteroidetes bacterium]|nr:MAG: T9SS type A sorting domain-containing protein [Bacteroidota bacterium]
MAVGVSVKHVLKYLSKDVVHFFFAKKISRGRCVVFSLFFFTLSLYPQEWVKLMPSFSTGDTLLNMSNGVMVTKNIGWFSAIVPTPSGHSAYRIFKTTDGGYTWTKQHDFYGDTSSTKKILDVALNTSLDNLGAGGRTVIGLDSLHCYFPINAGLLKTTNGGVTWEYKIVESTVGYGSVYFFFDELEGFAYKKYPRLSTDGGNTWMTLDTSLNLNFQSDVYFPTRSNGWITGFGNPDWTDAGYLIKSNDSGKTWQFAHNPNYPPSPLIAIDFVDSLHGCIICNGAFGGCFVRFTENGGASFRSSYPPISSGTDIALLDSVNGWVPSTTGKIASTTDGGISWNSYDTGDNISFGKISVIRSERMVYVFGEKNTLLRADLTTDVREDPSPVDFILYQNYPNPFNPVTVIRYSLSVIGHVTLKIYDMVGKDVATLVNAKQQKGSYEIAFNASGLPGGIYFYRLSTGSVSGQAGLYTDIKKMLLMK